MKHIGEEKSCYKCFGIVLLASGYYKEAISAFQTVCSYNRSKYTLKSEFFCDIKEKIPAKVQD